MDLQKLVDAMNSAAHAARSGYHLTLGDAVKALEPFKDSDAEVRFSDGSSFIDIDSYRGYYSDLALEPSKTPITAAMAHKLLSAAIGQTFDGCKGGEYVMSESTPLWRSSYGRASGIAITGIQIGDEIILETKQVD